MQQNNQITKYSEKKSSTELSKVVKETLIDSNSITVYTNHSELIKNDECQLSSMVITEYETKKEPYEVVVGKFKSVGTKTFQVVKSVNNESIIKIIKIMVLDIFSFYGREITENNLKSISDSIYKNYYWLKLSEFRLFIERMKGGYFQQMHNLSPAVFMERLKTFADESLELRTEIGGIKQNIIEPTQSMTDEQKAKFSLLMKELATKIERKQNAKVSEYLHRNAEATKKYHSENEFCMKWLRENGVSEKVAIQWYHMFLIRK